MKREWFDNDDSPVIKKWFGSRWDKVVTETLHEKNANSKSAFRKSSFKRTGRGGGSRKKKKQKLKTKI